MAKLQFVAVWCHPKVQTDFEATLTSFEKQEGSERLWVVRGTSYRASDGTVKNLPLVGPTMALYEYGTYYFKDMRWQKQGEYPLVFTLKSDTRGDLAKCETTIWVE